MLVTDSRVPVFLVSAISFSGGQESHRGATAYRVQSLGVLVPQAALLHRLRSGHSNHKLLSSSLNLLLRLINSISVHIARPIHIIELLNGNE